MVSITRPEDSDAEHERMIGCAEAVLEALGLPYRRMLLCKGDMGFSAGRPTTWRSGCPARARYREISSCSNCGDFQARRMDARFKRAGEKKTRVRPHPERLGPGGGPHPGGDDGELSGRGRPDRRAGGAAALHGRGDACGLSVKILPRRGRGPRTVEGPAASAAFRIVTDAPLWRARAPAPPAGGDLMRILLTNDDGIEAEGLECLERIARELSDDVWVVAPAVEQSGKGRGDHPDRAAAGQPGRRPALRRDRHADRLRGAGGQRPDGGPRPDLVLSGVNRGHNVGEDCS